MNLLKLHSDLVRDLSQRVVSNDLESLERQWSLFESNYPIFSSYRDRWIGSRINGASPLNLAIPWINYKALDFLDVFLQNKVSAFEYGVGGSTLYLKDRVDLLVSVEHDCEWYYLSERYIRSANSNNDINNRQSFYSYLLCPDKIIDSSYSSGLEKYRGYSFKTYVETINRWPDNSFDLVLVDGRARIASCKAAAKKVRPGGALLLDNSDYERYQSELLKLEMHPLNGWCRTDFLSPGPCSKQIGWQTTLWIRPEYNM